ncbi:MAG: hypothetical protein JWP45_609 [Mucilaginibacter sp.]|nr:hypothetical protein [Mucilaginibacter sp.]
MNFLLDHWDPLLRLSGAIIIIITFCKGVYEYTKQRADKRAQQFLELRKSFKENQLFQNIATHLTGDNDFSMFNDNDKSEFMAFFEDIAFLMNSGLIKKDVAFYMFSYHAVIAWDNDVFWNDEMRQDKYWSLLTDFVKQMKEIEATFTYNRKKIRL